MIKKILFAITTMAFLTSCIEPLLDEDDNPSSLDEVQDALAMAWGQADPLTMAPGNFLFQETEQKIDSVSEPFYVLQEGITIDRKEDRTDSYLYHFLYQTREYVQGQAGTPSTREQTRTVYKPQENPEFQINALRSLLKPQSDLKSMSGDLEMSLGFEKINGLFFACQKTPELDRYCQEELGMDRCDIQCSNLKTSSTATPVPEEIQKQEQCGNFQDCKINVNKVSFDWTVSLVKGEVIEKQRVNYSISTSQDLPFFARMTEYCFKQLYTVQNQKLLVSTCTHLRNYLEQAETEE